MESWRAATLTWRLFQFLRILHIEFWTGHENARTGEMAYLRTTEVQVILNYTYINKLYSYKKLET